ncbi:hypothetical protein GGR52DRAFT_523234 [Hypoxylon sp. FL1284]|nr:hypothetical protein GGR52DRAFT_523234 [Hypoxylon sp. FL1284]
MPKSNPQNLNPRKVAPFLDVINQLNTHLSSLTGSPAPVSLQLEADNKPHALTTEDSVLTSDLLSEYQFPLPPSRPLSRPSSHSAYSITQGSRPSSPFPALHGTSPLSTHPPQDITQVSEKDETTTRQIVSHQRSQSKLGAQKPAPSKPLPARPVPAPATAPAPAPDTSEKEGDEAMRGKQHLFQFKRAETGSTMDVVETARSVNLAGRTTGGKVITTVESKVLAASAKEEQEAKDARQKRVCQGSQSPACATEGLLPMHPTHASHGTAAWDEEGSSLHGQRLTAEQIIWLHKNYRGEATFLKAWGLHLTRDADREQGREILRVLMAAELQRGLDKPRRDDAEGR